MNIKSNFVTNEYDDDEWVKEDELNDREAFLIGNQEHNESRSRSRSRK